jgi:hypothetical protein
MIFQALAYDLGAANNKRLFIEIWLDHYISGLNAFLPFSSHSDTPERIHSIFDKILSFLTAILDACNKS